jgi:sodium/pantothenate symporter
LGFFQQECIPPLESYCRLYTIYKAQSSLLYLFVSVKPSLLVWINLFAFGGLEAVFFCPTLFGLYWRRANSTGAILSMLSGCGAFFWFNITKTSIEGTTAIVPTLLISVTAFVIGSYFGKEESPAVLKIFDM